MRFVSLVLLVSAIAVAGITGAEPESPPVLKLPPNEVILTAYTAAEVGTDAQDWGIGNMNVPEAWKSTKGKGIVVAVLDTGCAKNHKDVKDAILKGKDFTGSPVGWDDRNGHGTHCATTIAARENGWGMLGVAPEVKLLIGKVLSDSGSGGVDQIAAGIDWAVNEGADVISLSLGGPGTDSYIPAAAKRAKAAGVALFAAAGNDGPREGTVGYPGGYPEFLCIGAHDDKNNVAGFSSRGKALFMAAPGVNIRAGIPGPGDGLFGTMSGTSMATPNAAGLGALWLAGPGQKHAKKDRPAKLEEALRLASLRPDGPRNTASGYGRVDAAKLVPLTGTDPVPPLPPPATSIRITGEELGTFAGLKKALDLISGGKVADATFTLKP